VTDNGSPGLSATQTITITVNEVNNAPSLAALVSRTVNEGSLLLATNSATDPDTVPQTLAFSLDPGAPAGMTIEPGTGLIQWTPGEAQGPGTYAVGVRVTDDGDPAQSDVETLTVFVVEVNTPPDLAAPGNRMVNVGETVTFTAAATDPDFPAQGLVFGFAPGAPIGASIDGSSGVFSWTPGPPDAGTTNSIGVTVSDFGSPPLSASRAFVVVVMSELRASISRNGETVLISIPSIPGRTYRLEFKNALGELNWEPLGSDAVADGHALTFADETGANGPRFYRVVLVP
jgi:hypothetical protein